MRAERGPGPEGLRTVVVFHSGDDGGPARTLEPRIRELAVRGEATALFPWDGAAVERYAEFASTEVVGYAPLVRPRGAREAAAAGWSALAGSGRLVAALRRARPDVVVVATTVVPEALVAARVVRAPVVLYAAEIHDKGYDGRDGAGSRLTTTEERLATTVVACSAEVARAFRGARVVYPGIEPNDAEPSRNEARSLLGVAPDAFVVAAAGNLTYGRGQDVLIRAIAELADGTVCLIAGAPHPRQVDLDYRDELTALIARLGLTERVRLLGHADVAPVFAAADVVVNPARFNEPFGRASVEAIVARRPVVSTRVGAVAEVLGDAALLVPRDDPGALADALTALRAETPTPETLETRRAEMLKRYAEPAQTRAFVELVLETAGVTESPGEARSGAPPPPRDSG